MESQPQVACLQDSVIQIANARNVTDCQFGVLSAVQKVLLLPEGSIFVGASSCKKTRYAWEQLCLRLCQQHCIFQWMRIHLWDHLSVLNVLVRQPTLYGNNQKSSS